MCVCAEGIAVRFGGEGDGGDDEAVYGQGGYREVWLARADLVDVVQDEEQAGFLEIGEAHDTPEILEDGDLRYRCGVETRDSLRGERDTVVDGYQAVEHERYELAEGIGIGILVDGR